eukprot:7218637-Pyramimonas_sp.AAC.2
MRTAGCGRPLRGPGRLRTDIQQACRPEGDSLSLACRSEGGTARVDGGCAGAVEPRTEGGNMVLPEPERAIVELLVSMAASVQRMFSEPSGLSEVRLLRS